jgi:mercuric ion binding protein
MNYLKISATALLILAANIVNAQSKTDTIKVSGNCDMCAKTIETSAKKAGASKAKWDEESKLLVVTYDASKTTNDAIQKKVAATGYDTEKYVGDDQAYHKLHGCCQYDGKRTAENTK